MSIEPNKIVRVVLSGAALILGIVTIVVTLTNGGGITARGILFGTILTVMGSLRLFLTLKHDV